MKLTDIKGGKIDDSELAIVEERIKYAKFWLENYAPGEYVFEMTKEVPEVTKNLTSEQKEYLKKITTLFENEVNADSLQVSLYELSKQLKIKTSDAFSAIYLAFIGKTHGPRAGMLLSGFGKQKVFDRINEIMKVGDKK
jgi:lysyl-tRNA synthetase class 1